MTQFAGTTDTFDLASLKESLDPVIWDLFPMDTYFQNHIDKVNVGQPQHQWIYDSLTAAANNKQIQGDDASYTTLATAVRVSNYTQIARKAIIIADTIKATDTVGGDVLGREMMKKMKEYKRDVEFDLLGRQGSSAGATNTAPASGGVCAWIFGSGATSGFEGNTRYPSSAGTGANTTGTTPAYASAVVAGQTDGTTSASTVTLNDISLAAQDAWTDGGEPEVLLVSASQKVYIDQLTSLATRTVDVGRTESLPIVNTANVIVTSFGTFKVILSRYLNRTTSLILQMDKWAMGQLRAPKVTDMAKTGDATKKMIVGEYTLIARNPNASAKLQGFKE
jgi:hypothetical protein